MQATALILAISRAADASFDQILRARETQVLRTAFRILGNWADAEDVAQETFLRLHRRGLQFDHENALAAWLYRVTVNLCFDRARAARPTTEVPETLRTNDRSAESGLIADQRKRQLMDALATLPPKERAAVTLREIEGLSTAEVAEILGSSEVTVRSQISKAIARLRDLMAKGESK